MLFGLNAWTHVVCAGVADSLLDSRRGRGCGGLPDSLPDSPPDSRHGPRGVAPAEETELALRVVVVPAIGAIPVVLLEDLLWAVAVFTTPPEAVIVVPTCPADPITLAPWSLKRTPLLAVPVGAIELPLGNQLLARRACPCPLPGHVGAVGPRPWHHTVGHLDGPRGC